MEEKIISSLNGVWIYGVISICIFFAFFSGMLLWAFARSRHYLDQMGRLPLEAGEKEFNDKIQS